MKNSKFIAWLGGLGLFMLILNSCADKLDGTTFFTTDEKTIIETLEANPEKYSMYVEILKKTEFYNSLKSYGTYTCFVPTNEALTAFIKTKWNVTSISELNSPEQIDYLKTLVKFHTIPTKKTTSSFIEGRLTDTTYTGDFLTTSYLLGGGIANVQINREVQLDQYDINANNGVIQAIKGVLTPYIDPLPKTIENTGKYTIFTEALKKTGYYDTFSVVYNQYRTKNNFTLLIESDAIYKNNGINSFADLVNFISPGNSDYTNVQNDLNRFVAYHASQNFLYSKDFPADGFINTILANNAVKSFKTDKILKLNESENDSNNTWTSLISTQSNYPSKNGVYHTVDKILTIFTPKAKHIIFDVVSDQPEIQSGLIAKLVNVESTAYAGIRWYPEGAKRWNTASPGFYNSNVLDFGGYSWLEFDTPVLPKGKYEMLICSNGGNSARGIYQVYWDGEPVGSVYDLTLNASKKSWVSPLIATPADIATMESKGWRFGFGSTVTDAKGTVMVADELQNLSRFVITKELLCPVQQRHVFRLSAIKTGGSPIDYIEWIPVN